MRTQTLDQSNKIGIRRYPEHNVAEVEIRSDFGFALDMGLSLLTDYIFGYNSEGRRISRTIPALRCCCDEKKFKVPGYSIMRINGGRYHRVAVSLPFEYTLDNTPAPLDHSIFIKRVAGYRAAVCRFDGILDEKLAISKTREMDFWLHVHDIYHSDTFIFAQYNPPYYPSSFRRNELMVKI